jgi:hypothetical protein
LPTFGESWHVVHVPGIDATCSSSFSPLTPVILTAWVLKISWPRATAARAAACGECDACGESAHASNNVNAARVECGAGRILAQRIVDADEERFFRQVNRTALRTLRVQLAGERVAALRGVEAELELDDLLRDRRRSSQ